MVVLIIFPAQKTEAFVSEGPATQERYLERD